MKLKDIKNDGLFEKKELDLTIHPKFGALPTERDEGYNQALAELSEAELVVDEEKMKSLLSQSSDWEWIVEALSSSMSEWLRLSKGE